MCIWLKISFLFTELQMKYKGAIFVYAVFFKIVSLATNFCVSPPAYKENSIQLNLHLI